MDIKKVLDVYSLVNEKGVIISYQGPFLQEMIEEIGNIINNKMANYSELPTNGKYLSLFIELSQNILRYSADSLVDNRGNQISNGIILMGIEDNSFYIISGNPVDKNHEKFLKEQLPKLENSSREELNKLFKKQLKSPNPYKFSKGAGLGLIDISRKADSVDYNFNIMPDGRSFFTIKIEYKL